MTSPAIRLITLLGVLIAFVAPAFAEFQCVGGPADGTVCVNEETCPNGLCVDISPPPPCGTCPALLIGSASGLPGDDVIITATFRPGPIAVSGVQNDLRFDPNTSIVKCKVNPDINKGLSGFSVRRGAMRGFISGLDLEPLSAGILYTCSAHIAEDAAPGTYPLRISHVLGSDPSGTHIDTTGEDGAIVVGPRDPAATPIATRSPTPTATLAPPIDPNGVATFTVSSNEGMAGDRLQISIAFSNTSSGTSGVQNDLLFAAPALIAPSTLGSPDCSVNAALAAIDSRFIFIPFGCRPGDDCRGIRAQIARPANLDAAGSLLYTCTLQVDADAPPGRYPLRLGNTVAGTGEAFQFATRNIDGEVVITTLPGSTPFSTWTPTATATATPTLPPPITIEVGHATGMPGDDVTVNVILRADGAVVNEVFSNLNFTADTQITRCAVNPETGKDGVFGLRHVDDPTSDSISECTPDVDCNQMGTLIVSKEMAGAIPDNIVLYTCTVRIADTAASGNYALIASGLGADDLASQYIPAVAIDGSIEVVGGPTRTPTPDAGGVDSAHPPARQPGGGGGGLSGDVSGDGCAIVPVQTRGGAASLVLLVGLALAFGSLRRPR